MTITLFCASLFIIGFQLPPSIIPPKPCVSRNLDQIKLALTQLDLQFQSEVEKQWQTVTPHKTHQEICKKYRKRIDDVVGKTATPGDLALLSIWAERKDPCLESQNHIYSGVFYLNLSRLSKIKGRSAAYAMWQVRNTLFMQRHLDGHIADEVAELQQEQASS